MADHPLEGVQWILTAMIFLLLLTGIVGVLLLAEISDILETMLKTIGTRTIT